MLKIEDEGDNIFQTKRTESEGSESSESTIDNITLHQQYYNAADS
jgi:hypothetical protein